MKKFKFSLLLSAVFAIALFVFSPQKASAQTYGTVNLLSTTTNVWLSSANTNYDAQIDMRYNRQLSLYLSGRFPDAAVGTNVTITASFQYSGDAVTWDTATNFTLVASCTMSNQMNVSTNVDVGGRGWVRLRNVAVGAAVPTNIVVSYSLKPGQ